MAIQYARNNASSGHLPGMLEFLVTPTFRIPPAPPASHNETRYLRIRSRTETDHQSDLARIFLGRILVRRRPINTLGLRGPAACSPMVPRCRSRRGPIYEDSTAPTTELRSEER